MVGPRLATLTLLAMLTAAGCSDQGTGTGEAMVEIRPEVCANPHIRVDGRYWASDGLSPWREATTGSFSWGGTRGTFTGPDGQTLDYVLVGGQFPPMDCAIG